MICWGGNMFTKLRRLFSRRVFMHVTSAFLCVCLWSTIGLAQMAGGNVEITVEVDRDHVPVGVIMVPGCGSLIPDLRLLVHEQALQNAVVSLHSPSKKASGVNANPSTHRLQLRDCAIWPRVQTATVHDRIGLINKDADQHEVLISTGAGAELTTFLLAPQNHYEFEVAFSGQLKIQCFDHPWEKNYLWVFDHPHHGVTNECGIATISGFEKVGHAQFAVIHELWPEPSFVHVADKRVGKVQLKLSNADLPHHAQNVPSSAFFTRDQP